MSAYQEFHKFNSDKLPMCDCGNMVRYNTFVRALEKFKFGLKEANLYCTKCQLTYYVKEEQVNTWLDICKTVCTCPSSALFNSGCTCGAKA